MTESTKLGFQIAAFMLISIGIIIFLDNVIHSGNAIEACSFNLSLNTFSLIGAVLVILPTSLLLILYIRSK